MAEKASPGTPVVLQDTVTTGNGAVVTPPPNFKNHLVILKGSAGINAGKVKVETADTEDYAGDWALIGAEQTLVASTELAVNFTGIYKFVRARVSTNVVGGTLTAYYYGA